MDFQKIPPVQTDKGYLDIAFSAGRKRAESMRQKRFRDPVGRAKSIGIEKLKAAGGALSGNLQKLMEQFPSFSQMPAFYQELARNNLELDAVRKSLGALKWAKGKVNFFIDDALRKITSGRDMRAIEAHQKECYGRVSSVMRQVRENLKALDLARRTLRSFPTIKDMRTAVIIGFPNVGKTTLLARLSGSTPAIDSYPFTTKGLNVAYLGQGRRKIQLIDTPGTLNRGAKMNLIERQTQLVLKHYGKAIVYVFDPTGGYPIEDQKRLYEQLREEHGLIVYVSKTDIAPAEATREFVEQYSGIADLKTLRRMILSRV
ncbi:50S ribosome-binding GTPase [Candidatus Woesearchaeota archaeon]|nr:50S ribosome-binding GTPase [Candidatus Woesearchaeota archaeon]